MTSPCEFIDIALTLQQAVRDKGASELGFGSSVAIGTPCGEPATLTQTTAGGTVISVCELHARLQLVNL